MPGSLLAPHDALSDRSEASYGSTDSRASAKKVSFNRAVRVKQYPWTPEDSYTPEDGQHLSLPSRRFWFKVYKVKPQTHNGDQWQNQNGITCNNGHTSHLSNPNSWEGEDNAEDTYDSLAPIVEDDGDHDDKNHVRSNGVLGEQHHFQRSQVKDIISKFSEDPTRRNGTYTKNGHVSGALKPTATKNPVIHGFKTVLAKSQAKLKGERKDSSNRNTPQNDTRYERYNYRGVSPPKYSGAINSSNGNSEKFPDENDNSSLSIKIPRAESPRRGRDNIERFSMRYKTQQRRSRSTDDAAEASARQLTDKSVSTDDLDSPGLSWMNRDNKDKSTQCNGTLMRGKPLTAYGTPRLSRSSLSNLVKREEHNDKKSSFTAQNRSKTDVKSSRPCCANTFSTDENPRTGRTSRQLDSGARDDARRNGSQIITKPRIATGAYRWQNKSAGPVVDTSAQQYSSYTSNGGFGEVKSAEIYERAHSLSVVPEERTLSRQPWNRTPATERRASSWERSGRPAAATVGYQSGRYLSSQRLRGDTGLSNGFETSRGVGLPKARDRPAASTTSRHTSEAAQNTRRTNGSDFQTGDTQQMIDWSLSGFQFGPPTVDRDITSDSECFVHQRQPLLMYIPGVSHHEKPAVEDDRLSGISGMSRVDMDDDLRLLPNAKNSYALNRRNSMPKDCNKSWVKWKTGGKPSRQP